MSPQRGIRIRDGADRTNLVWGFPSAIGAFSGEYYPYNMPATSYTEYAPPDRTAWRPFVVHVDMEVSGLTIEVMTAQASGLLRLGLYAPNSPDLYPDVLVEDLGTVDASTTGAKDAAFSANRVWAGGEVWWFCLQTNDLTIGIRGINEKLLGTPIPSNPSASVVDTNITFSAGLPDPAAVTGVRAGRATPNILVKIA